MTIVSTHLRHADLVAKLARVSLKDTARVLLATQAVRAFEGHHDALEHNYVPALPLSKPTPENIAACEQAAFDVRQGDTECREDIDEALAKLRTLL